MDSMTPSERSARMRLVKASDTKPELAVRALVKKLGYRFLTNDPRLPGCPDLVFVARCKVVFVHGCFWHRHNGCRMARLPKSGQDFWQKKLSGNVRRDASTRRALTRMGLSNMVVWECELSDPVKVMFRLLAFLEA